MADVACLGILVADTVGKPIDALPEKGSLQLVERMELHSGGCAANTGVSLAKIGVATAVLGKIGADGFGDFLCGALERHGLDISGLVQDASVPTSATMVLVHSDSERSFLHVTGANADFSEADVAWESVQGAKILHIAGLQLMPRFEGAPLARVLERAKREGMTTTLDTVMNPRSLWWEGIEPALPHLDWVLPSHDEAVQLTGETDDEAIVNRLFSGGARNVAIKHGAMGSFVACSDGARMYADPVPVTAVDSLGAGDAWVAGFLTGLLHEWPLLKTARFANAVGACCVQALGATTGIKPLRETLAMIAE